MLNTETIVHPKLQHLGLTTGNLQPLLAWYKTVLGMRLIYLSENPIGAPADSTPSIKAVWLSNDEANHRIAVVEISGLVADPERPRHQRLQHVAFAYSTLDDLLGTYVRLKALGILPAISVDEGSQTAFYYEDPDRNSVELNVSNYAETWASIDTSRTRPSSARRRCRSGKAGRRVRDRRQRMGTAQARLERRLRAGPSPTIPRYCCEKRPHNE